MTAPDLEHRELAGQTARDAQALHDAIGTGSRSGGNPVIFRHASCKTKSRVTPATAGTAVSKAVPSALAATA